jgi:hypothetical protein
MKCKPYEKAIARELASLRLSGKQAISKPLFLNVALKHIEKQPGTSHGEPVMIPVINPEQVYDRFLVAKLIEEQSPPDAEEEQNVPSRRRSTVRLRPELVEFLDEEKQEPFVVTFHDLFLITSRGVAVKTIRNKKDQPKPYGKRGRENVYRYSEMVAWWPFPKHPLPLDEDEAKTILEAKRKEEQAIKERNSRSAQVSTSDG